MRCSVDDQTKLEIAVGRWAIYLESRNIPNARELRDLASKVMVKHYGLAEHSAHSLTGDQALLRTNLAIALHQCGVKT